MIDAKEFRTALGQFATGVTIVTTVDGAGAPVGVTVNSFNSVSLDPPLILWSLAKKSYSVEAFSQADRFAVHVLAADQQALSDRFARASTDKFAEQKVHSGLGGLPVLEDCVAVFECAKRFCYEGGDHWIFVGEVERFSVADKPVLLFYKGRYTRTQADAPLLERLGLGLNPVPVG